MSQTDRKALVALCNATGGAEWKKNRNWNTSAALSQWYGVEVNSQGRVVKLTLESNNLRGPIPPELGNLTALRFLDFEDNRLNGFIPPELVNLRALQVLYLYSNQLNGPIPPELGNLGALTMVDLAGNELAGGPETNESLGAWKTRLQSRLAEQKQAEQERAEQERAEQECAEQKLGRQSGDVGRWLLQDLGFDGRSSAVFGASIRACHLDNPKAIFAIDRETLEGILGKVEMPDVLASLVMEAWRRRRKEDEDCRRVEGEAALIGAHQRAESAAEERRRQEEVERTNKKLQEAEALAWKNDAAAKAEAERQRLEEAALDKAALRQQQALHTPLGRWLKMEAHFNDTQASRFCAGLEGLGISSTHALKVQESEAQQQLVIDLNMNK